MKIFSRVKLLRRLAHVRHQCHSMLTLLVRRDSAQIYGAGFVNRTGLLRCRFGDNSAVEGSFASSRVLRCLAPAQKTTGAVDVTVSIDGGASFGGGSGSLPTLFRYLEPSFVTGLSPRSGPDTGGTVITVLGTGFSDDFLFTCSFHRKTKAEETGREGEAETSAVVVSSSELNCIAPRIASGIKVGEEVELVISADYGGDVLTPVPISVGGSRDQPYFTYVTSLQLTMLKPDRGPAAGGTVVEIGGANFLPPGTGSDTATAGVSTSHAVWCQFGTAVTLGSRISDTLIRCSSPPRGAGLPAQAEVGISVNGGADFARGAPGSELVSAKLVRNVFCSCRMPGVLSPFTVARAVLATDYLQLVRIQVCSNEARQVGNDSLTNVLVRPDQALQPGGLKSNPGRFPPFRSRSSTM